MKKGELLSFLLGVLSIFEGVCCAVEEVFMNQPEIDYHMPKKKKGITKSLGLARSFLSSEIPPFSLHFSDVFEC